MYTFEITDKADVDSFAADLGVKPCYSPLFVDNNKTYECASIKFEVEDVDGLDFRQVIMDYARDTVMPDVGIEYFYQASVVTVDKNTKLGGDFKLVTIDPDSGPKFVHQVIFRFAFDR